MPELQGLLDLFGRLVVAGAFALAAVLKLADLTGLRGTLYLARLTRPWVPQLTVGLPLTELAAATALLSARAGWVASVLSAALLLAFVAFLAADRTAGDGCNCFGRRSGSSRRAGIGRDVVLIAALLPALLRGPGPGAGRYGVPGSADRWLAAGAALAAAGLLTWAFRRDARLRRAAVDRGRRRAGRPASSGASAEGQVEPWAAPEIDLPALAPGVAGRHRLDDLLIAGPVLVVFVEPGCSSCELLLPRVAGLDQVLVLVGGPPEAAAALAARYRLTAAVADEDGAVADAYRVTVTPSGALVTPDRTVVDAAGRPAARPAVGVDAVAALLQTVTRS